MEASNEISLINSLLAILIVSNCLAKDVCKTRSPKSISVECKNDELLDLAKGDKVIWKFKDEELEYWSNLFNGSQAEIQECTNLNATGICAAENVISTLLVTNFTQEYIGNYSCFSSSNERIYSTYIDCEYAFKNCTFYIEANEVECCWDERNTSTEKLKFKQTVSYSGKPSREYDCSIKENGLCCDIELENRFDEIKVSLRAYNEPDRIPTTTYALRPSSYVMTSPPVNIKVFSYLKDLNVRVNVSWDVPIHRLNGHCFLYKIRFKINENNTHWKDKNVPDSWLNRKGGNYIIQNEYIEPRKPYVFQVAAKPCDGQSSYIHGFWSNWSDSAVITTVLTAPKRKLQFKKMSKSSRHLDGATYSSYFIRWKVYPNPDEEGFLTKICCGDCNRPCNNHFEVKYANNAIFNTTLKNVCCSGIFCNKVGCSSREDISSIGTPDDFPLQAMNVSINRTNLTFSIQRDEEISNLFAHVCGRRRMSMTVLRNATDPYSACYIKGFEHMQVLSVQQNEVTILGEWNPCEDYLIYIEKKLRSKNLRSLPSEIVHYDQVLPLQSHMVVSDDSFQTESRIKVEWTQVYNLEKFMRRLLTYKAVGGTECMDRNQNECGNTNYKIVPKGAPVVYLEDNIYGNTVYEVRRELTCADTAKNHNSKHYHVEYPGLITEKTSITKPGKPRNLSLSAFNTPIPILSWKPPIHRNGPDVLYEIKVLDANHQTKFEAQSRKLSHQVDISCQSFNERFNISITAVNEHSPWGSLRSESVSQDNVACIESTGKNIQTGVAVVTILSAALFFFGVVAVISYCHRAKIKSKFVAKFYAPAPAIPENILSQESVVFHSKKENSVSKDEETYHAIHFDSSFAGNDANPCLITPKDISGYRVDCDEEIALLNSERESASVEYVGGENSETIQPKASNRNRTISSASTMPYTSEQSCSYLPIDENAVDETHNEDISTSNTKLLEYYDSETNDLEYLTDADTTKLSIAIQNNNAHKEKPQSTDTGRPPPDREPLESEIIPQSYLADTNTITNYCDSAYIPDESKTQNNHIVYSDLTFNKVSMESLNDTLDDYHRSNNPIEHEIQNFLKDGISTERPPEITKPQDSDDGTISIFNGNDCDSEGEQLKKFDSDEQYVGFEHSALQSPKCEVSFAI